MLLLFVQFFAYKHIKVMFQYKCFQCIFFKIYFLFHLTGQKRARSETKIHFRLQSVISKFSKRNSFLFVYDRAMLISETCTGKYLPARYRIGGNRHRAVFFLLDFDLFRSVITLGWLLCQRVVPGTRWLRTDIYRHPPLTRGTIPS